MFYLLVKGKSLYDDVVECVATHVHGFGVVLCFAWRLLDTPHLPCTISLLNILGYFFLGGVDLSVFLLHSGPRGRETIYVCIDLGFAILFYIFAFDFFAYLLNCFSHFDFLFMYMGWVT